MLLHPREHREDNEQVPSAAVLASRPDRRQERYALHKNMVFGIESGARHGARVSKACQIYHGQDVFPERTSATSALLATYSG